MLKLIALAAILSINTFCLGAHQDRIARIEEGLFVGVFVLNRNLCTIYDLASLPHLILLEKPKPSIQLGRKILAIDAYECKIIKDGQRLTKLYQRHNQGEDVLGEIIPYMKKDEADKAKYDKLVTYYKTHRPFTISAAMDRADRDFERTKPSCCASLFEKIKSLC